MEGGRRHSGYDSAMNTPVPLGDLTPDIDIDIDIELVTSIN